VVPRDSVEFLVNEGNQVLKGCLIPLPPSDKQPGDIVRGSQDSGIVDLPANSGVARTSRTHSQHFGSDKRPIRIMAWPLLLQRKDSTARVLKVSLPRLMPPTGLTVTVLRATSTYPSFSR